MKQINLLKTLLLLCALMVGSSAWAAADVTYDFTGSDWTVSDGTLTNGTVSFTGYGKDNFKMNGGYFMLGKNGAYINFPTYGSAVSKIVVTGRSGASSNTKMNVYVGETAVSTETTGCTGTNTYEIASGYQAAGTVYSLKVTSNHNAQVTKIEVYFVSEGPTCATPTFSPEAGVYTSAQNVEISTTTDDATIYYTTDGSEPTDESTEYTSAISVSATTTIKAIAVKEGSNDSEVATATYVISEHAGTAEDPFSVADAIAYIGTLGTATSTNDVYVQGKISQIDTYASKTITYWISDDGTTDNQMEVYKGKGINGADFSSIDDLLVGGTVVVKGKVKMYNSIPEFDQNSQLVSYDEPQITKHTLTVVASNGSVEIEGKTLDEEGKCEIAEGKSVTATATPAEHYSFASWTAEGITLEDATANPLTFAMPENDVTLTANFTENPSHIVTFSILGATTDGAVVFEGEAINFPPVTAPTGYAFVGWTTTKIDGTQTAAPEDLVTSAVMGDDDITYYAVFAVATATGEDTYEQLTSSSFDANATYVIAGKQSSTIDTMYYLQSYENVVDTDVQWGYATTDPANETPITFTLSGTAAELVAQDNNGNYLTCITAKKFAMSSTSTTVYLADDGAIKVSEEGNLLRYNYNTGNGGFRWYASTTGTQAYFYKVIPGTTYSDYCTSISVSAEVTTAGWATYITPAAVEFGEDEAYVVTDASIAQGLALEAITEAPANTPVLLKGAGEKTFNVVASAEAPETNMLVVCDGTIEDGYYAYVLAKKGDGATFKQWTGEIETLNGRVILPLDQAVALAREFFDLDGETTGIDAMHNAQCTMHNEVFDLQGRRVAQPTKGLYIVNGKKVVIK